MSGEGPESIPTSADPRSKRPVKKRALTPVSAQAKDVDALFARPDREIRVPEVLGGPPRSRLAAPPEIVTNVQGSSAGAGSGEFHVYKASRRREYERLRQMDEEVRREKDTEDFEKERREREARDAEKTRKNREKRERKMKARKANNGKGGSAADQGKEAPGGNAQAKAQNGGGDAASTAQNPEIAGTNNDREGVAITPTVSTDTPGLLIHDDD
jgi:hypothetical protein